ncbi:unnamed protein product [Fusarium graminearum]|nr:unnamed protein product [Fusarium graminearum]
MSQTQLEPKNKTRPQERGPDPKNEDPTQERGPDPKNEDRQHLVDQPLDTLFAALLLIQLACLPTLYSSSYMVAINACQCSADGCINALDALPLKCGLPKSTLEAKDILPKVTAKIVDHDSTVGYAAYNFLRRQLFLPDTILEFERLHHFWPKAAFEEDVYCYADGGVTYLNMPSNLERVQHNGNSNDMQSEIHWLQKSFGAPSLVGDVGLVEDEGFLSHR